MSKLMMRRLTTVALTTLLLAGAFSAQGAPLAKALVFTSCGASPGFSCAQVAVPLDRSGQVPGALSLSVERLMTGPAQSQDAVLALAGGPGQAALPLSEFIAKALPSALSARDLLVFDQRGTGQSDPLSCPALSGPSAGNANSISALFLQCAQQIGPGRGSYTTEESVQDIESVRQATGYEKLVLFGVSYGTKVALEYAERYPQHVEALLLDSVVPTDGPDTFALPTFKAITPALGELCSRLACTHITPNPVTDIARLATRLSKHSLKGSVYDGSGRRHSSSIGEVDLLYILEAGDLNPALRALLPGAVRSALRNDPDPLLRLNLLSEGLIPNLPGSSNAAIASAPSKPKRPLSKGLTGLSNSEDIDETLFASTTCEESPFPWSRNDSPSTRLSKTLASLHSLPGSDFYPFDWNVALQNSSVLDCLQWPYSSAIAPPLGPPPDVPTLILSGTQDLRTPTSNAQRIAAVIPGAQLLVVPYTGHSVLGSDFSGCAQAAVTAFFQGTGVQPCKATTNIFSPTPISPTKLDYVQPVPGISGKPGRTLTAVLDTMLDLNRQVIGAILQANQELPNGSSFGGLRGGYARIISSAVHLNRFSFLNGVQLTGTFPIANGQIQTASVRVEGSAASPGVVRIGSSKRVSGTLSGKHFNVSIAKVKLASNGGFAANWQLASVRFPLRGLARLP
jgi:pimeloyl-ACP methyl ester carboxylesterase